jgi:hypothetical protein
VASFVILPQVRPLSSCVREPAVHRRLAGVSTIASPVGVLADSLALRDLPAHLPERVPAVRLIPQRGEVLRTRSSSHARAATRWMPTCSAQYASPLALSRVSIDARESTAALARARSPVRDAPSARAKYVIASV